MPPTSVVITEVPTISAIDTDIEKSAATKVAIDEQKTKVKPCPDIISQQCAKITLPPGYDKVTVQDKELVIRLEIYTDNKPSK